jgi:hypothetical protein
VAIAIQVNSQAISVARRLSKTQRRSDEKAKVDDRKENYLRVDPGRNDRYPDGHAARSVKR